jgi:hypothetical protein
MVSQHLHVHFLTNGITTESAIEMGQRYFYDVISLFFPQMELQYGAKKAVNIQSQEPGML